MEIGNWKLKMEDEGEIKIRRGMPNQRHRPFISAPPALSPHLLQSSSFLNMAHGKFFSFSLTGAIVQDGIALHHGLYDLI